MPLTPQSETKSKIKTKLLGFRIVCATRCDNVPRHTNTHTHLTYCHNVKKLKEPVVEMFGQAQLEKLWDIGFGMDGWGC